MITKFESNPADPAGTCMYQQPSPPRRHRRAASSGHNSRVTRVASVAIIAAILTGAGTSAAWAAPQPGTGPGTGPQPGTSTPQQSGPQPGTTTPASPPPAVAPAPRPQEQSPLGNVIPDPPQRAPEEYRPAPSQQQPVQPWPGGAGDGASGWESGNTGNWPNSNDYPSSYQQPAPPTSLNDDLAGLHAPRPVDPPKVILPVAPDKLGVGDAWIWRPNWFPGDAAYDINGQAAEAQRTVDAALNSVGFSPDRSTRMGTGIVAGAGTGAVVGALLLGVPAAVAGGVAGGLIGGTIGGVTGAAAGTLIPIPGIATVTSGVAGTAVGAAAGAAIGAAAIGIPAAAVGALAGGTLGGTIGAIVTAGDGSDYTPRPEGVAPATPPSLHDQLQSGVEQTTAAIEQGVDWVEAQPGGPAALESAVETSEELGGQVTAAGQPWVEPITAMAPQAVQSAITAAESDPATAPFAEAAIDVLAEQAPFAPDRFGPLTDAANGALAGAQALIGPQH